MDGWRLLREAGIDWTDIERLVGDRDGYREHVREKVGHIEKWDRQKGHKYVWEEGRRQCGNCGGWVSRGNNARHLRSCRGEGGGRGESLLGVGGSVRSAAGCSRRRTWRGTRRVVARSGTPEGDIGPDGAECRRRRRYEGGWA